MADPILKIGQSGLETTEEKVRALTNRIVNAETPGFKGSDVIIRSFPVELHNAQNRLQAEDPRIDGTFYDQSAGPLNRTGNQLDLAIGGNGFFAILAPFGEGYTRDGRFALDSEGRLVTVANQYPLLGKNGPIVVTPGSKIDISQSGDVRVGEVIIDRIRVVDFQDKKNLETVNGTIFKNPSAAVAAVDVDTPRIAQGFVETSNVSEVNAMMDLVVLNRIYNMDAKIVSVRDQIMSKALEMGKVQ